jgi:hypothetical protein
MCGVTGTILLYAVLPALFNYLPCLPALIYYSGTGTTAHDTVVPATPQIVA